ncbi:MAG TPA: undecaprenyl-diphosphate phosphatase [Pirellulales bacterium]|nr:undecaprenyl-diphosphate phosphatase [Pirellulales bacterium]
MFNLVQLWQILLLAVVQGAAELLPVSSSAHVIVAAKLLGYEWASDFDRAFFLVMLHTGTMFAVLIYFWSRWKQMAKDIPGLILATACTAAVGLPLIWVIEKLTHQDVEHLFQNLPLIGCSLLVVGVLIIIAGRKDEKKPGTDANIDLGSAACIGLTQGLALPFRGFSRSGSTISSGMLHGIVRYRAEEFSFALAVILTPAIILFEGYKMWKLHSAASTGSASFGELLLPGLLGMVFSFAAGLIALKWLSQWLEAGRWKFFGFYCLFASAAVLTVHFLKM